MRLLLDTPSLNVGPPLGERVVEKWLLKKLFLEREMTVNLMWMACQLYLIDLNLVVSWVVTN